MNRKYLFRVAVTVFVAITAFSSNIFACACCTEPGTYVLHTSKPSEYMIGLLKTVKFKSGGTLFQTDAGFDAVKGIAASEDEMASGLDLVGSFLGSTWDFTLRTGNGKLGKLILPLPAKMVNYRVDQREGDDRPNGPLLYKELRFNGTVGSGSGIVKPGIVRPTSYFLVLQGRGNNCDDVRDFTHWRLEISGRRAQYAFFGELEPPS